MNKNEEVLPTFVWGDPFIERETTEKTEKEDTLIKVYRVPHNIIRAQGGEIVEEERLVPRQDS